MLGLDTFFHKILFGIIATVANVVDVLIDFIRMILGLSPLEGTDNIADLLGEQIWANFVLQTLGLVAAISVAFIFIFALIRLVRAQLAEKDEGGHWKAIRGILESIALMFVIPLFAGMVVLTTSVTARAIDNATQNTYGTTISYSTEVVFSTVGKDMLTPEGKNWFYGEKGYQIFDGHGNKVEEMTAVKLVYEGWETSAVAENNYYKDASCTTLLDAPLKGNKYSNLTELISEDEYFDTFILPMLGGFVMLCALAMASITITQRIFSVIFLFIISPLPASTRPLDDGARYKKWSEIFLGKVFGGYGIIFALNVFFSLCPLIVSNVFFINAFANGVAKLIVYISGVVFATGANVLIGQLIGADAGTAERDQASQNFRTTMSGAYWTGAAARGASHILGYPFGRSRKSAIPNPSLAYASPTGTSMKSPEGKMNLGQAAQPLYMSSSAPLSATIGGAMGRAGVALANGEPATAAKSSARSVGNRLASMRITRAAIGVAMLAGGTVMGAIRGVRSLRQRNAYGGLTERANRAKQKYEQATTVAQADKAWKKFQKLDQRAKRAHDNLEAKRGGAGAAAAVAAGSTRAASRTNHSAKSAPKRSVIKKSGNAGSPAPGKGGTPETGASKKELAPKSSAESSALTATPSAASTKPITSAPTASPSAGGSKPSISFASTASPSVGGSKPSIASAPTASPTVGGSKPSIASAPSTSPSVGGSKSSISSAPTASLSGGSAKPTASAPAMSPSVGGSNPPIAPASSVPTVRHRYTHSELTERANLAKQQYEQATTVAQADKAWKKFQKLDQRAKRTRDK